MQPDMRVLRSRLLSLTCTGVGQRQRGLQQELRQAQDALAKDLSAVDEQRDAADASIESLEKRKLLLRQQLHVLDEKLHAAREGQRSWLAERDRLRRAVDDTEAAFRQNLKDAEALGLAARKERAAAEKARARALTSIRFRFSGA